MFLVPSDFGGSDFLMVFNKSDKVEYEEEYEDD